MSHPDPIEVHDHVYGFRPSAHVPGCPDCAAAAERLEAERRELRDVLAQADVEPPADLFRARSRAPWAALAAAAGLLAGLIWLMIPPTPPALPAAPQADEAIVRLIAELKGPSALKREIALLALKAYGAQAHAPLVAAGVDAAEFQTPSEADIELEKVLDTVKRGWDYQNENVLKILDELLAASRLPVSVPDEVRATLDGRAVTLRTQDLQLRNVLKLCLSQFKLDFYVLDGRLRVGPPREFMTSSLPIRVGGPDPAAAALVKALGAADLEVRAKAIDDLRRLDFSAEEALWAGLDAPDPETAGRAADLLRSLYTPTFRAPSHDPKRVELSRPVTASFEETPLTAAVDTLRERLNVNVHISGLSTPDGFLMTFACRDLPGYAAFRLMLDPQRLAPVCRDGVLLVTLAPPDPEASPEGEAIWMAPEAARRLNAAFASIETPEAEAAVLSLGPASIGPLRAAARRLPRARALLVRLYKELDMRLADDPPRAYLASLSPAAGKLLDRTVDVDIRGESLPDLLRRFGIAVRSDQPDARTFTFKVAKVTIRAVLDALTRCSPDLDWRMDGETVVLDTPGNIRSAVER